MEKLKPWDRNELQRREEQLRLKCESKLEAVDWDMMKKHLTPEDRKAYERLCTEVRSDMVKHLTDLLHTRVKFFSLFISSLNFKVDHGNCIFGKSISSSDGLIEHN